jgi:hypothetical protein
VKREASLKREGAVKRCTLALRRRAAATCARATHAAFRFVFAPASAMPLAVLRIGLASVLLVQAVMIAPLLFELYGQAGIVQGALRDALTRVELPHLGWLLRALAPLGVGEAPILVGTGVAYVLALMALLLGAWTRVAAALAWLTHLLFMVTADSTNYGADMFANIFLFYLVWAPSGAALSLDRRLGRAPAGPTPAARLALRVVQIHLCIVYLAGGIEKASGPAWWNGEAIWRALMLPEYRQLDLSWLARHAWLAAVLGWGVLVVEIGYAFLIWPRLTRRAWVAATAALHLGIAVFMGLGIFGAVMIVLTVAAFGVNAEVSRGGKEATC